MRLPEFCYHKPETVQEACALLAPSEALPVSGGTDLLVNLKHKLFRPSTLVDLKGIATLDLIQELPSGEISLGALATLRSIERSSLVRERLPLLGTAARAVGTPQIRNKATLGGNTCLNTRCWYYNIPPFSRKTRETCNKQGGSVCHVVPGEKHGQCYSLFSGDVVPALLAMDARITVTAAEGSRVIPLKELYTGDGVNPIALRRGELVTEVLVTPLPAGAGSGYVKLRERGTLDFPIIGVAAVLLLTEDRSTCRKARIVLTGVSSAPLEAVNAEAFLENKVLSEAVLVEAASLVREQIRVYALNGVPSGYKRSMIAEFSSRSLLLAKQAAIEVRGDRE